MKLTIVPTPIGNLKDITYRAVEVLGSADLILAEDTRTTKVLLNHYGIEKHLESYHKFNEHQKLDTIIDWLKSGMNVVLVSDAGTPGISDPGFLIVRKAVENEIEIETLPGATAFVPALVNSGLPCDKFIFEGFLPVKKGRQKTLKLLAEENRTLVFYESPYRIHKAIDEFIQYFGADRKACICREISKIFEQNIRGTLAEIKQQIENKNIKGEIVVVVAGKEK